MSNISSSNIDDVSSSNYSDACSNSVELNEFVNKNNSNKKSENSSEKNSFIKDETTSNYESPPKKSLKSLNNINNYTNGSTAMLSSNRASKLNNLMISNKESLNKEDEKVIYKNSRNRCKHIRNILCSMCYCIYIFIFSTIEIYGY